MINQTKWKVLGIRCAKGKNDKIGYNYYFAEAFSDYEVSTSEFVEGTKVSVEFSYTKFDCKVGDNVTLVFEKAFNGQARLVNVVPFATSVK